MHNPTEFFIIRKLGLNAGILSARTPFSASLQSVAFLFLTRDRIDMLSGFYFLVFLRYVTNWKYVVNDECVTTTMVLSLAWRSLRSFQRMLKKYIVTTIIFFNLLLSSKISFDIIIPAKTKSKICACLSKIRVFPWF